MEELVYCILEMIGRMMSEWDEQEGFQCACGQNICDETNGREDFQVKSKVVHSIF